MISYKDRTFCTFSKCTRFSQEKCNRALTPEVIADAEKWWGNSAFPVSTFADMPICFTTDSI